MGEYYKILGVSPDCSDAELEEAYQKLKNRYTRERFMEGEIGNEAARKLQKIEEAYNEITDARKGSLDSESHNDGASFSDVEAAIKDGNLTYAQSVLDRMEDRSGEWHYLESVIFYKQNHILDSKRQLEIALEQDPQNQKYKDAYEKLLAKIRFSESQFSSGNRGGYQNGQSMGQGRQMGGDSCMDFCANVVCYTVLCNSCCR